MHSCWGIWPFAGWRWISQMLFSLGFFSVKPVGQIPQLMLVTQLLSLAEQRIGMCWWSSLARVETRYAVFVYPTPHMNTAQTQLYVIERVVDGANPFWILWFSLSFETSNITPILCHYLPGYGGRVGIHSFVTSGIAKWVQGGNCTR